MPPKKRPKDPASALLDTEERARETTAAILEKLNDAAAARAADLQTALLNARVALDELSDAMKGDALYRAKRVAHASLGVIVRQLDAAHAAAHFGEESELATQVNELAESVDETDVEFDGLEPMLSDLTQAIDGYRSNTLKAIRDVFGRLAL